MADGETEAVRTVVARVNQAWRASDFAALEELLHERVVFTAPGLGERVLGRAACIDSYRQFMAAATVVDYVEHDVAVEVWGATAVVTVRYEIAWEMEGTRQREGGHDVLVLARDGGRWQVTWRTLVPASG